jgi:hypothetical protein
MILSLDWASQLQANKCRYACKNLVGSFMCICPEGYREVGIDQCVGKYNNVGIVHGPFGFLFSSPGADPIGK